MQTGFINSTKSCFSIVNIQMILFVLGKLGVSIVSTTETNLHQISFFLYCNLQIEI